MVIWDNGYLAYNGIHMCVYIYIYMYTRYNGHKVICSLNIMVVFLGWDDHNKGYKGLEPLPVAQCLWLSRVYHLEQPKRGRLAGHLADPLAKFLKADPFWVGSCAQLSQRHCRGETHRSCQAEFPLQPGNDTGCLQGAALLLKTYISMWFIGFDGL